MRKLGALALVLGFTILLPLAGRAEGSEGEGLQAAAEAMRQAAIRDGGSGWRNGEARLVASGTVACWRNTSTASRPGIVRRKASCVASPTEVEMPFG